MLRHPATKGANWEKPGEARRAAALTASQGAVNLSA